MTTSLANTCATRYGFVDKEFTKTICQDLQIEPQRLIKLKQIQRFDTKVAKSIIYTIYPIPIINTYIESFAPLLIIKLTNHSMIFR